MTHPDFPSHNRPNSKGSVAVALKVPEKFAFALASVLMDLKSVSPTLADEIVIFHDGMSRGTKASLRKICDLRFERFRFPTNLTSIQELPAVTTWSPLVFASFDFLTLLNEFDSVIQLDYDLRLLRDISDLLPNKAHMTVSPSYPLREFFVNPIENYDLQANGFLTWSFSSRIRNPSEMRDFCYEKLAEHAQNLRYPEMAILAMMQQEFSLEVKNVPGKIWTPHPLEAEEDARILHSYGGDKFWTTVRNEIWEQNYSQWLQMGGRPYLARNHREKFAAHCKKLLDLVYIQVRKFMHLAKPNIRKHK